MEARAEARGIRPEPPCHVEWEWVPEEEKWRLERKGGPGEERRALELTPQGAARPGPSLSWENGPSIRVVRFGKHKLS